MLFHRSTGITLAFVAVTKAHFALRYPKALGLYDVDMTILPCDNFDPNTAGTVFSNYPWQGSAMRITTTHPHVTWEFNVALMSDYPNFVPLAMNIKQIDGVADMCFGQIPGKKEYVGQKAVIQIKQHATDGNNIQVRMSAF
jgi:hypothetical protein